MILPQTSGSEEEELVHDVEVAAESLFHLKITGLLCSILGQRRHLNLFVNMKAAFNFLIMM